MPNWCNNEITVTFSNKSLFDKWSKKLLDSNLELNELFLPRANFVPGNNSSDWHPIADYWGTKWEVDVLDYSSDDSTMTIYLTYQTAWGPNLPVTNAMYKAFKKVDSSAVVTHLYSEPGVGFRGYYINGTVKGESETNAFYQVLDGEAIEIDIVEDENDKLLFLETEDRAASFLILDKIDKQDYDLRYQCLEDYCLYKCFSETFGKEVHLIKWNKDFYANRFDFEDWLDEY